MNPFGLADTIFSGGGTDEVMVQDVYDFTETTPRTSFISKVDQWAGQAAGYIRDNPQDVQSMIELATDLKNYPGQSPLDIANRIRYTLGDAKLASLANLGGMGDKAGTFVKDMAAKVGVSPELVGKFKSVVGDVASSIMTYGVGDQPHLDVLQALVNDTKLFSYLNLEHEVLMFEETLRLAGMSGGFNGLMQYLANNANNRYDNDVWRWGLMNYSRELIFTGDLESLKAMLGAITVEEFLYKNPDAIKVVLSSYRNAPSVTPEMFPTVLGDLISTIRRLDPKWPYVEPLASPEDDGRWRTLDFSTVYSLSPDAQLLFLASGDVHLQIIALQAPNYPLTNKESLFAQFYPDAHIGVTE